MNTPRIKICGLTNFEDAQLAIRCGAHALGFNGWKGSKRFVDLSEAQAWIDKLPELVSRIAVLVNPTLEEALAIAALPAIDAIQLHGDETPEFCCRLLEADDSVRFIKAIRVSDESSVVDIDAYPTQTILLDSFHPDSYGGTCQSFPWELARRAVDKHPGSRVILAGGLTPENVARAWQGTHSYGVDVASGVEVTGDPRRKDPEKVEKFCQQILCVA